MKYYDLAHHTVLEIFGFIGTAEKNNVGNVAFDYYIAEVKFVMVKKKHWELTVITKLGRDIYTVNIDKIPQSIYYQYSEE